MAYTLRNPYTLPGGNSISGGPGQSDDPNNSLNLGLGAIYKSDLMQGTDANFITQNTGMDLNQWQESQNGINQQGGALSDLINGLFGTLMFIPDVVEGLVASAGTAIRQVASDISQGKSAGNVIDDYYSTVGSTTWSYIKAGYDMSANNGFRMLEDLTGQYTAMDKWSNTAKFFMGLGVDIASFLPAGEISAAVGLSKGIAKVTGMALDASFNAASAVEKDMTAPLFQRNLARNIADVTGGWERATSSLNPLINKTANFLWSYKNLKAKLFQYGKGLTQQTLAKMRLNSGLITQAKNVANKLEETNISYKRQFVDRALSDMSNEDDKSILETIFKNTDKYYTEGNKKFTAVEKAALRNGTAQKLPRAERQILKSKLSMGFDTQASAEIEKKLPYTGTYENTIVPLAETIGAEHGIHKIVVNTDEVAEARKLADPLKVWDQHTSVGELDKTLPVRTVDITKSGLKEGKEAITNLQKDTGPMAAARKEAENRLGKSEEVIGKLGDLNSDINNFKKKIGSIEEAKDIKNEDLDKLSTDLLRIREMDPKFMQKILNKDYEVGDETFEKALALVRKYGLKEASEGLATNKVTKDFFSEEFDKKITNIKADMDEIIQHASERRVFEHEEITVNKTKYGKAIARMYRENEDIMKELVEKVQPKITELQKENEIIQKDLDAAQRDLDSKTFDYNTKKIHYETALTQDVEMFSKVLSGKDIKIRKSLKSEEFEKRRELYNTYKEWESNERSFAKVQKEYNAKTKTYRATLEKNVKALKDLKEQSNEFMKNYAAKKEELESKLGLKVKAEPEVEPVKEEPKAAEQVKEEPKAEPVKEEPKVDHEIEAFKAQIAKHTAEIEESQKDIPSLQKKFSKAQEAIEDFQDRYDMDDLDFKRVANKAERVLENKTTEEIAENRNLKLTKQVLDLHNARVDANFDLEAAQNEIEKKGILINSLNAKIKAKLKETEAAQEVKAPEEKVAPVEEKAEEEAPVKEEAPIEEKEEEAPLTPFQQAVENDPTYHYFKKEFDRFEKRQTAKIKEVEADKAETQRVIKSNEDSVAEVKKDVEEWKNDIETIKARLNWSNQKFAANIKKYAKELKGVKNKTIEKDPLLKAKKQALDAYKGYKESSEYLEKFESKINMFNAHNKTELTRHDKRLKALNSELAERQKAIEARRKVAEKRVSESGFTEWERNERQLASWSKAHDAKVAKLKESSAKAKEEMKGYEKDLNDEKIRYQARKEEFEKTLPKDPEELAKILPYSKLLHKKSAKQIAADPVLSAKKQLVDTYKAWKLNEATFEKFEADSKAKIETLQKNSIKSKNNLKNFTNKKEKLDLQYFANDEKMYQLKLKSIEDTVSKHKYYESLNKEYDEKIVNITNDIAKSNERITAINQKFDLEKDAVSKSKVYSADKIVNKIDKIEIKRSEALRNVEKDVAKMFEKRETLQKLIEKNTARSEKYLAKPGVKRMVAIDRMTKKLSRPMPSVKRFGDMEDFQKEMEYAVANRFLKNESQRELQLPKRKLQYVKKGTWMDSYTGNAQRATNAMFAHAGDALGLNTKPYESMSYMKHTLTDPGRAIVTSRVGSRYVGSAIYHGQKAVMSADRKMYGSMVEKEIALGLNKADAKKLINAGFDMNGENALKRAMQIQDEQLRISNILKSGIENGDIVLITRGSKIDTLLKDDAKGMALFNKKIISWREFEDMYHASTAIFTSADKEEFDKILSEAKPKVDDLTRGVAIDNHLYELAHQIMNPKELNKLALTYQKVVGKWKFLSILNPNFFIRITVGNYANAMANTPGLNVWNLLKEWGSSIMHMHRYNKFMAKLGDKGIQELMAKHIHDNDVDLFNDILKKYATPKQRESINLITQAYKHNLINFGGQMRTTSLEDVYSLSIQNGMRNEFAAKTMKVLNSVHTLTSYIDDGFKIAQWQRLMKNDKLMKGFVNGKIYQKDFDDFMAKNGHLMESGQKELFAKKFADWKEFEAAKITKFSNFDYSEITAFEKQVVRNFVPFWTWFSKNIALQIKMFKKPYYANIVHDLMNAPFTTQLSPYMTSSELDANYLPIKIANEMVLIKMNFPAEDVVSVFHPDILNRLNPMISFAYCLATGRDLSTGYNTEPWNALIPTAARNLINRGLYQLYVHNLISQTDAEKYFNDNPKAWIQNNSIFRVDNAQENFAQNVKKYIMQAAQNLNESQRFLLMHQRMLIKNMMTNPTKTKKFYIPK